MNALLVLTVDLFDGHASAAVTLTSDWVVEQLPITGGGAAPAASLPQILGEAMSQCAVAAARRLGVLSSPEQVVISHPPQWNQQQCAAVHAAAKTAGLPATGVLIRPRPVSVPD